MHTICSVFFIFLFLKKVLIHECLICNMMHKSLLLHYLKFWCSWWTSDILNLFLFFLSLLWDFPYLWGQLISLFLSFYCRYPHNNIPPNIIGCIQILTFCLINWIPSEHFSTLCWLWFGSNSMEKFFLIIRFVSLSGH